MAEICRQNITAYNYRTGETVTLGSVYIDYSITTNNATQAVITATLYVKAAGSHTVLPSGSLTVYNSTVSFSSHVAHSSAQAVASTSATINKTHSAQNIGINFYLSSTFRYTSTGSSSHDPITGEKYLSNFKYVSAGTYASTIAIGAKYSYTVSYNNNGGSGAPGAQTKWYNENLTLSATKPTKTGHSFVRWNTNTANTGAAYAAGGVYGGNAAMTLYAIWKADTYAVAFNANGGSSPPANQTKTYGTNLTLTTAKPTRSGYTFVKWNTKADGTGTSYNSGASYTANAAVTLYAIWTANKFIIHYNDNGGTQGEGYTQVVNETTHTINYNDTIDLINVDGPTFLLSKSGYHIDAATAWNRASDGSGTSYDQNVVYSWTTFGSLTTQTTNVPLYANWKPNKYTLTFVTGSEQQTENIDKTMDYNQLLGTLPTVTRIGYRFDGWYSEAEGGDLITPESRMPLGDTTYYAHWSPVPYAIDYNMQGGTNDERNFTTYYINSGSITLYPPQRQDYTFIGWTGTNGAEPILEVTFTPDVSNIGPRTYIANWRQTYFAPALMSQTFLPKRYDNTGHQVDDGAFLGVDFYWQPGRTFNYTYDEDEGWQISNETEIAPYSYDILVVNRATNESTEINNILIQPTINEETHTYNNKVSQVFDRSFFEGRSEQVFTIDETIVYDIRLTLHLDSSDIHAPETTVSFVSKAYFCIDINGDGTAIGFGTSVKDGDDADEGMHVDMDITLRDERDFYIMVDESSNNDQLANILDALGWLTATSNIGE